MNSMPSGLLSPNQVAKKLGVHVGTVYRWLERDVRGRRLKSCRVGGRRKISEEDLDFYLWADSPKEFENTKERHQTAQNSLRMFGIKLKDKD